MSERICEACEKPAENVVFSPEDGDLWFCDDCYGLLSVARQQRHPAQDNRSALMSILTDHPRGHVEWGLFSEGTFIEVTGNESAGTMYLDPIQWARDNDVTAGGK